MNRKTKWALGALALLGVLILPYELSPGKRFARKPESYYVEFAAACDSLLTVITPLTNRFIQIDAQSAEIPSIVRDIRPQVVQVSSNRIWIHAGSGHIGGYAVIWEPNPSNPNEWSLKVANDALDETLFTKRK